MANGLTNKQRVFIEAYLVSWNASDAARKARYAKPGQQGHRLLKNVEIAAAIQERLNAAAMPANEVLARLTQHGSSSMEDFVDVDRETLDLDKARTAGKLHLIKKFTRSETKYGTNVSIEIYDAQAALVHIGKHHGLFTDKVEHSGPNGGPIPIREMRVNLPVNHEPVDS